MAYSVGDDVLALLREAKEEVLIIAPFIKAAALSKLLDVVPAGTRKTIVTRCRVADFLAGVSDLEVFDVAASRDADVRLCQVLHAKLYVADDSCLVGSANVTGAALGWRSPANLELLSATSINDERVAAFLLDLESRTTPATRRMYEDMKELVASVDVGVGKVNLDDGGVRLAVLPTDWIPRARSPEELYAAYVGEEDVTYGLYRTLREELSEMGVVDGLSKGAFYAWLGEAIGGTPLVRAVTEQIDREGSVTESGLRGALEDIGLVVGEIDVRDLLEVLERWLTEFLPGSYETARDSIKLTRPRRV